MGGAAVRGSQSRADIWKSSQMNNPAPVPYFGALFRLFVSSRRVFVVELSPPPRRTDAKVEKGQRKGR